MRKIFTVMMVFAVAMWVGCVYASAQTWTWKDPILLSTEVTELAGDPGSDAVYGITPGGEVVRILDTQTVTGVVTTAGALLPARDVVATPGGSLYAVADGAVSEVQLSPSPIYSPLGTQPKIPAVEAKGSFTHIASGLHDRLYVLFQAESGDQYLLVGFPPVVAGMLTVGIDPRTLNIKSRGNWVSCRLELAPGYEAADVDVDSVTMTRLEVPGFPPVDYGIVRAPGSPVSIGKKRLMLKFWKYDKESPANPQSLNWQLASLLGPAPKGRYPVTATVLLRMKDGSHTGEWLSGTATFHVVKPTNK